MKKYPLQEKFLDKLFSEYKSNNDEYEVFIKVKVLDFFYSTNLKEGLDEMVKKICEVSKDDNFDKKLKKGDKKLINKICKVKSTLYGTKDCTSFASKYCSRYEKDKFPIYDKLVKQMLCLINEATNFTGKKISINKMKEYEDYCSIVDKFINKFNEGKKLKEQIDYKSFDRYIWTWAKEILHKINKS